jgi:Transposase IS66 family
MTRFAYDGQLEIDNNIAERSIRPISLGKKNWMFAGSDNGGARAAAYPSASHPLREPVMVDQSFCC